MKASPPRLPRWCRALLALAVGCVVACISAELLLRWLLLGSGDVARRFGKPFRVPSYWIPNSAEEDSYKLQTLFDADRARPVHGQHPILGWIADVHPDTWAHRDEPTLQGRRPVLLFGDSFSQCVTTYEECWQGLLNRSDLGASLALLNYGIGGYGVDQMSLLAERVVPRFADRDPIVVVAVLVDDDIERCFLTFRGDAKPVFRFADGELVLVPPGDQHRLDWIADHPPQIPSYLLRLIDKAVGGFETAPGGLEADVEAERIRLVDAIFDRIRGDLAANGIRDWFVLLFHGEQALSNDARARWQEDVVTAYCRRNDVRCVSSRPYLEAAIAAGLPRSAIFVDPSLPARGHYGAAGNLLAMEALLQGLRHEPAADPSRAVELVRTGAVARAANRLRLFAIRGLGGEVRATSEAPCLRVRRSPDGTERLAVRADDLGVTELEVALAGARCVTARVRAIDHPENASPLGPPLVLTWQDANGRPTSRSFDIGAPEVALSIVDLDGQRFRARVERPGGDPRGAWLMLDDIRFDCDAVR